MFQLLYGVAALFLIVKVLPPEEFGSYVLAQGLVQFITLVSGAMVYRFLIRELSRENWDATIPFNSLILAILLNVIVIVPIVIFKTPIASIFNAEILGNLLSLSIPLLLGAMLIKNFTQRLIISLRDPVRLFVANGSYFMILTIGLIYLNFTGNIKSASQVINLSIFSATISAFVGLILSSDIMKRMIYKYSVIQIKRIMSYGKYSVGAETANMVTNSADSYLISYLLGPVQVAYYNSAKFIYKFYQTISQILDITYFPYSSKLSQEERFGDIKILYEKILCVIYLFIIPGNLIAILFAEKIMNFIYGDRYAGAHIILQLFIIAATFQPLSSMGAFLGFALNKPKRVLYGRLITLFTVIGSGYLLIPKYGVEGMAIALAIGFFLQSIFMTWLIKREVKVTFVGVISRIKDIIQYLRRNEKA